MDKDTATKILYKMVADIGTLEQRNAMDIVIAALGYKQVDSKGVAVVVYEPDDEEPSHGYWEKGDY